MFTLQKFEKQMMKTSRRLFILSLMIMLSVLKLSAQTDNKDVTITSSGSGKTMEEAKQAALRSATEQAFGAFISSKTEMFNDQVVADQMASVSSGNIKSYEIMHQDQLPDGRYGVTLKAVVSVDKLTSFVQAKGVEIEIKGGMFALNIKQQLLNEQGEIKAVAEMVGLLHEPMQVSFDYVIKSGDPKALDAESKNWEIPLVVTATANKNIDFCANYCIRTLAALSLSSEEVTSYQSLNKAVFTVVIKYKGDTKTFYLRKQSSIDVLNTLTSNWEFYTRLFTVQSGMDESNGNGEGQIFDFGSSQNYKRGVKTINFLTAGQQAATFSWQDKHTLSQIEQMTGYKVKPIGVVSQFKHGGFVVFEKNGHGLVAAIMDLGEMDWESANTACNELILNGYSDWRLPSKKELYFLYHFLKQLGVGGFAGNYWSSTEYEYGSAWYRNFYDGRAKSMGEYGKCYVRAVRAF
jgi:methionine-rich copper-binding protein CopC